jgi:hypothetical protein
MRRTVRVIAWLMKGGLLAVCLAAGVAWVEGGGATAGLTRVARVGTGEIGRYSITTFAVRGGGAWVYAGEVRIDPTDRSAYAVALRGWLQERSGWRAEDVRVPHPWDRTPPAWTGFGRLGVMRLELAHEATPYRAWAVSAPLWGIVLATGAWPVTSLWLAGWRWRRRGRAAREGLCPACGYDWRATPGRCPECGRGRSEEDG